METIRKSGRRKNNEVHIKSNNQSVYEGVMNSITPIPGLVYEDGHHCIIFKDSFLLESYLKRKIEAAKEVLKDNIYPDIAIGVNSFIKDNNADLKFLRMYNFINKWFSWTSIFFGNKIIKDGTITTVHFHNGVKVERF